MWQKQFINLFLNENIKEAYRIKQQNIPRKLYKYLPLNEESLDCILDNNIWFSIPKKFNDPFDCLGVFWDSNRFKDSKNLNKSLENTIEALLYHIKVSCFSEDLYSMPMWASYSNKYSGFCVEYDFSILDESNEFSKYLFPVAYEENRYDITNLIEMLINNTDDPRVFLLFFLMQIKHKSWSYEKEWRIFNIHDSTKNGIYKKCPVEPTNIFLGINCGNDKINQITKLMRKKLIKCPVHILQQTDSNFFNFKKIKA